MSRHKINTFRAKIGIQETLRLVEICVKSNKDHARAVERLERVERVDFLLKQSCLESQAIDLHWERTCAEALVGIRKESQREQVLMELRNRQHKIASDAVQVLRVNVLRHELGVPSVRRLSLQIGGNVRQPLLHGRKRRRLHC